MKLFQSLLIHSNIFENYDYSISYQEFDDIEKSVWRRLSDEGNWQEAIDYMLNYLKVNKNKLESQDIGNLYWHVGQIYALNDDYNNAVKFMSQKEVYDTIKTLVYYRKATVSFLRRDLKGLKNFYRLLKNSYDENVPDSNRIVKESLSALTTFINNFDKTYKELY